MVGAKSVEKEPRFPSKLLNGILLDQRSADLVPNQRTKSLTI